MASSVGGYWTRHSAFWFTFTHFSAIFASSSRSNASAVSSWYRNGVTPDGVTMVRGMRHALAAVGTAGLLKKRCCDDEILPPSHAMRSSG